MASSILSSLGRAFSGGASGIANRLGTLVGQGISSYAGGVSSGAANLGTALGSGLAGLVRSSGSSQPSIIQGTPSAPAGQRQYTGAARSTFGSGPGRPVGAGVRRGTGAGPGGSTSPGTYGGTSAYADLVARQQDIIDRARQGQANQANVSAYNAAFAKANQANESRYQQLLDIADKTSGQRAKDIGIDYAGRESNALQNLARLGLSNTTIAPTLSAGFGRQKNAALDRLADQMQQTKLGIIERRQDLPPDLASLISLGKLGISGLKF